MAAHRVRFKNGDFYPLFGQQIGGEAANNPSANYNHISVSAGHGGFSLSAQVGLATVQAELTKQAKEYQWAPQNNRLTASYRQGIDVQSSS
jgi:hypothetical protein